MYFIMQKKDLLMTKKIWRPFCMLNFDFWTTHITQVCLVWWLWHQTLDLKSGVQIQQQANFFFLLFFFDEFIVFFKWFLLLSQVTHMKNDIFGYRCPVWYMSLIY